MAEYIERAAAYEKCGWYNTVNGKSVCAVRKDELAAIPAADVAPVVHGRWIGSAYDFCCSACGVYQNPYTGRTNFCPNCGAHMKDGE